MPLEIVIPIEALWALVALERAVVWRAWLPMSLVMGWVSAIHMLHARYMPTIKAG